MRFVCVHYACQDISLIFSSQITKRLGSDSDGVVGIDRFRGNIIVRGGIAFKEDDWKEVVIQGQHFNVIGPCTRCQMICVNPITGERTNEPLRTLATFRRESVSDLPHACASINECQGRVLFGQHLAHDARASIRPMVISVGEKVTVTK